LLIGKRGGRLKARGVERVIEGLGKQSGVEVTPHVLRHTFAKNLVDRLRQPAQLTNEGKRAFREAIDKVEAANDVQRRELFQRAITWNDRELARVLTVTVCGDREKSVLHEQLKELDPDINKLFEFEAEFGAYSSRMFGDPITIRRPSDITSTDISAAESRLDAATHAQAG